MNKKVMDIINNEKKYPTLVEVVNNPQNPQKVEVTNLPLYSGKVNVQVSSGTVGINTFRPTTASLYLIQLDNILLLQSDGTFVPIPLNSLFMSVTQNQINSMLESYKSAYSTLVSGVTAATLHYSKQNSSGAVTSEVYNLKD